jgi:hypothetical protein
MKTELVLDHYDFIIPTWAVTAIEYGEYDSLSDSDIEMVEAFIARLDELPEKVFSIEYGDDFYFRNFNDMHNLGDDCVDCKVYVLTTEVAQ